MKKNYLFSALLLLLLLVMNKNVVAQPIVYNTTGTFTYTVPKGVTGVNVDMAGGKGGNATFLTLSGGGGGRVQCVLTLTAGKVLNIVVGGAGADGMDSTTVPGGYNNTGAVGGWCNTSSTFLKAFGGGGGASEICIGGTALANRKVVAGGGGGAGNNCSGNLGGNGGGLTGANAPSCSTEYSGTGGGQSTYGLGGTFSPYGTSDNGAARFGGAASTYPNQTTGSPGGGGYFGGGGGSWGGGGSSYTDPLLVTGPIHTQGYNTTGDGYVKLTLICETPQAGAITGTSPLCPFNHSITLANSTGSSYGIWSSSNTAVATIDSTTGVVKSGVPGTTTITFKATTGCGTSATTTVTLTVIKQPNAGIIKGADTLCVGNTTVLSNDTLGGWSSKNTSIATVNAGTGAVTGIAAGKDTIFYTLTISGCAGVAKVPFIVLSTATCLNGVNNINGMNEGKLTLYPSPSSGTFTIGLSTPITESAQVIITNVIGERIKEITASTNKPLMIQLNAPGGLYFVTTTTSHGTLTDKIMIER